MSDRMELNASTPRYNLDYPDAGINYQEYSDDALRGDASLIIAGLSPFYQLNAKECPDELNLVAELRRRRISFDECGVTGDVAIAAGAALSQARVLAEEPGAERWPIIPEEARKKYFDGESAASE
jgi:hypothetical protein